MDIVPFVMWLQHNSIAAGVRRVRADPGHHLLAGPQVPDRAARPHPARRRPLRSAAVPTKIEKDAVTGRETTGHEWDGVKELNTPLPKWWLYVFYATHRLGRGLVRAVSVGALGARLFPRRARLFAARRGGCRCARSGGAARQRDGQDQDAVVRRHPQGSAAHGRAPRRRDASPSPTTASPAMGRAAAGSRVIPRWRRAPGSGAARSTRSSRPSPMASAAAIPMRATAQMPRFGADGILKPAEIQQVADYVMTLYGHACRGQGRHARARRSSPTTVRSATATQGRAIARRARRGWRRRCICMATTVPSSWRRSPRRAWA